MKPYKIIMAQKFCGLKIIKSHKKSVQAWFGQFGATRIVLNSSN